MHGSEGPEDRAGLLNPGLGGQRVRRSPEHRGWRGSGVGSGHGAEQRGEIMEPCPMLLGQV